MLILSGRGVQNLGKPAYIILEHSLIQADSLLNHDPTTNSCNDIIIN